ncbi:MAG: amidohydrolase family protein [Ruminococcus sp.]|nr:amidohydrolase family protein [Ruminococcus sp.]
MIIDFHVHCFNPKIAAKAVSKLAEIANKKPLTGGLIEETTALFDKWGVDKGVMLNIATKPTQQRVLNDWAAQHNNTRFYCFGSVHPEAEDLCEELDRIKELGLYGVKFHPDYQDFMIDEQRMDAVYDELEKRGLPVVFHAGWDCVSPELIHVPPERTAKMIKRHPHLKVILAHLGGNDMWQEVYDKLAGAEGEVYFDTAFTALCPDELMKKIIIKHGADRILFGSDCPWESSAVILEKLKRLGLRDSDLEKILGTNALKILGK